jgi:NAD(P)-dependent dehydrogenase (short-subunit alcohol dehydrogenase family)
VLKGVACVEAGRASGLRAATGRYPAKADGQVARFDTNEDARQDRAGKIDGPIVLTDGSDGATIDAAFAEARARLGRERNILNCAGIALTGQNRRQRSRASITRPLPSDTSNKSRRQFHRYRAIQFRTGGGSAGWRRGGRDRQHRFFFSLRRSNRSIACAATKEGVVRTACPLAPDLRQHRIRVATTAPGKFITPKMEGLSTEVQRSTSQRRSRPGRLGQQAETNGLVGAIFANPVLSGEIVRPDAFKPMRSR